VRTIQVHIVHFDPDMKIQQVRLYWDQGSLLKLVNVIGARAKNWPIRDGKDQARLIASSVAGTTQHCAAPSKSSKPEGIIQDPTIAGKPRAQSTNVTRDPHASLSLFAPRDQDEDSSRTAVMAARASSKPPPRDYHDLFVNNDSDSSPQAKGRAASPQKENMSMGPPKAQTAKPPPRDYHDLFVGNESDASPASKSDVASPSKDILSPGIAKGGAGKSYKPSRLFDTDEPESGTPGSPKKASYKSYPLKYNHFDFGDGEDSKPIQADRPKTKHQSQWDFEDFVTPQKPGNKVRDQDKRHFGWEDDEPVMNSPNKHPAVAKPRPDAATNFEFQDDGTPAGDRRPAGHPRGQGNVRTTGLYQNNIYDDSDLLPSPQKKGNPLSTVTNLKDRRKDFDPQFSMTDSSLSQATENKHIPENGAKVVGQMGAQWEASDASPSTQTARPTTSSSNDKENMGQSRRNDIHVGIKSGGDGMGGKKGAGRSWGFGDESDEDGEGGVNGGKFQASKKQQAPKAEKAIWEF